MTGGEQMNIEAYSCRECKWRDDCRRKVPCKDFSPITEIPDEYVLITDTYDRDIDYAIEFRKYIENARYSD